MSLRQYNTKKCLLTLSGPSSHFLGRSEKESAAELCGASGARSPLFSWLSMAASSIAVSSRGIQTSGGGSTVIMVGFMVMGGIARSAC